MTRSDGFTLVEVQVATLLLAVGLLALTGVAAVTTRLATDSGRLTEVAAYAEERIEVLRAAGCPAGADGVAWRGPLRAAWSIGSNGRVRQLRVTVSWPGPVGPRRAPVATACGP